MSAFSFFLSTVKYLFLYQSCVKAGLVTMIPPSTFFVFVLLVHDKPTILAFMAHSAESTETNTLFVWLTESELEGEEMSCKTTKQRFKEENHNCIKVYRKQE